jgi:glutamate carboxypeptidase
MDSLAGALAWLDGQARAMEALLAELVDISSHTPNVDGNNRVAARLAEATLELGRGALAGGTVAAGSSRFGAHVDLHSAAPGKRVLCIGHHDTVFPQSLFAGFREEGALLRGPGVLDMKGGLVVVAYALGALAHGGVLARLPVQLVSISDEEVGSPDGKELVLAAAREAACALVFESGRTGDQIVTRRKGIGAITARAHGRAAHAGNAHEQGVNAIWALARFVDRAQALTDYGRGVTVNVGQFSGGIGKNTVPDSAEALCDLRFLTRDDGERLIAELHQAADAAAAGIAGARLELKGGITRPPLERSAASAALLAEYGACAAAAGLGHAEAPLIGGGSDANTVAAVGLPAIDGLGPRGQGFHTVDEYIERSSLVPKAAALTRFLFGRLPS